MRSTRAPVARSTAGDEQTAPPLRLPAQGLEEGLAVLSEGRHVEPVGGEIEGHVPSGEAKVVEGARLFQRDPLAIDEAAVRGEAVEVESADQGRLPPPAAVAG
jgi:hypothetical protein